LDSRNLIAAGYLLTAIAGWLDAQGFLALHGVFVSFMSGNTTLLGVALAQGNWTQAGPVALVIGLFLAGGFLGAFLAGSSGRWSMPAVLAVETAILAAALVLSEGFGMATAAAVVLALAMGVQNSAAAAVGSVKAGATYVTGTLVSAGHELGKIATGSGSASVFAGHMSLWAALLFGVVLGALADGWFGLAALIVPLALTLALAAGSAWAIRRT
jgi:uncharacterized membrane protein YoaK (UPF0700 family)